MKQYQARQAGRGYTLMEVMIVVAIVGTLMAIAVPGYQNSMQKSRRADGMRAVLEMASRQERFYAQNSRYTDLLTTTAGLNFGSTVSADGHYNLTATADLFVDGTDTCDDFTRCYTVTATPVSDGAQAGDSGCGAFSMNSQGVRSASGPLDADGQCW